MFHQGRRRRAFKILGPRLKKRRPDGGALFLFALGFLGIGAGRLERIGRNGNRPSCSGSPACLGMELDGFKRGLLLGSHALMRGEARVDAVGLFVERLRAPFFMKGKALGNLLPGKSGSFLAVQGAQIKPFFLVSRLHRLPGRVFFGTAFVDLERAFACVSLLLFELEGSRGLLTLFAILDCPQRLPFFGIVAFDGLVSAFARLGVKLLGC